MKKLPFLFMIDLFGCSDSEENASTNLRKGDEFFNKGEYEIAEYYYDKIPEESLLRKSVNRKMDEIQKIYADPTLDTRSTKKKEGVFVTKHTFTVNNLGILPLHTITVLNSTDQNLQFVELEFVYFDDKGKEVKRLTTVTSTPVPKNTQKEFTRISPGMVNDKFVRANVILTKPVFY
jgi:hypothetical protein